MLSDKINICLSSDDKYTQHLAVTITSILKNRAENDEFSFIILDGNISSENKEKTKSLKSIHDFDIEFVKVDNNLFAKCPIQDWTHLSIVTYYRLVLPNIKPEWDRIIYLDCDIVVRQSLKELFNLDIGDNYLAAVKDISEQKHASRLGIEHYCNTGVMLINAKKWREDNITDKLFEWIDNNTEKIVLHDQDILNAALQERFLIIDGKWNTQFVARILKEKMKIWENAAIIHFIDKRKPWLWFNGDKLTREYRTFLKETPYKPFLKNYYIKTVPKSLAVKFCKFIFDIGNISSDIKFVRILGFTMYIKRKPKQKA